MVNTESFVTTIHTEFQFHRGLSRIQRQRSAISLREAIMRDHPEAKPLEVSSFSDNPLGVALSAFNLAYTMSDGRKVTVECGYHGSKVFEKGGPYTDLLEGTSMKAKKDPRLSESGRVIAFEFDGQTFPAAPVTLFYTWLYLHALDQNKDLADQLINYNVFTDIVFNPERMSNCQAHSCAVYCALRDMGTLGRALTDIGFLSDFLEHSSLPGRNANAQTDRKGGGSANTKGSANKKKKVDSQFRKGSEIDHPKFGKGSVKKVIGTETSTYLIIWFDSQKAEKQLEESWVLEHCKY